MHEMPELRTVMAGFYKALSDGDAAYVDGLICRHAGVLGIGTDPDEWWDGHATLMDKMKIQMTEMAGVKIVGGEPQAYGEGTVAWVADRPHLKVGDRTESSFRLTVIFHKEQDAWKVVQFHTSVGVPNEEVIGKELTV
jgi:hypothetical protein